MDSLKKADIKGRKVRLTDDSGCKFVGKVDFVDYQKGKMGVTGSIEGSSMMNSYQLFFKSDIRKIVVFDDTPAVFAQMSRKVEAPPKISEVSKKLTPDLVNKEAYNYILIPGGSEYRGAAKFKHPQMLPGKTLGSAGETTDSSPPRLASNGMCSNNQTGARPKSSAVLVASTDTSADIAKKDSPVYARVTENIPPPTPMMRSSALPIVKYPDSSYNRSSVNKSSSTTNPSVQISVGKDLQGYSCYLLPSVITVPNLTTRDRHSDILTKSIKELIWPSPHTPPSFVTPARMYYVEREGDLYEEAVVRLSRCSRIGVSLEMQVPGRHGVASLLTLSSKEEVFIFDIFIMGVNAFKYGLYSVLANKDVVKVVHDCRQISDTLYHQFGLELDNVFDTLAGHVVFSNWILRGEQRVAKYLYQTVKDYLGVPDEHLYTNHYSSSSLKSDTSIWLARPLSVSILLDAARNSLYLLPLSKLLEVAIQLPVKMAVQSLLDSSVVADDMTAQQMVLTAQYLPREVECSLPRWKYEGQGGMRG